MSQPPQPPFSGPPQPDEPNPGRPHPGQPQYPGTPYPAPAPQPYPGQYPGQYPYGPQDPISAMVGAVTGIIQMFKGNDRHGRGH